MEELNQERSRQSDIALGEQIWHMPQLDGLRAYAVLFVIYYHWVPKQYHGGIDWGSLGVQLFFVLSGFLITGILLRVRDQIGKGGMRNAIKAFYVRRCLRIFPLYYAVVFAITILGVYSARETFWYNVTYTSNIHFFFQNNWPTNTAHFWTLAVEEQFYLMWPWVVLLVPQRRLALTIIGLMVVGVLATLFLAAILPANNVIKALPFAAWEALGGGALLATLGIHTVHCRRFARWSLYFGLPIWIVIGIIPNSWLGPLSGACRLAALVSVCIWIVYTIASGGKTGVGRIFQGKLLVSLGIISYGLYIIHPFVPIVWAKMVKTFGLPEVLISSLPIQILCCMAVLIMMAMFSWFLFERPINQIKSRFPYFPLSASGGRKEPSTVVS